MQKSKTPNLSSILKEASELLNDTNFDDALKTANKITKLFKDSAAGWNTKGLVYLRTNRYDQAMKCFDEAIRISPKHYRYNMNKGIVCLQQKNEKDGMLFIKKAQELDPKKPSILYNLGVVRFNQDNFIDGIKVLTKNLQKNPKHVLSNYMIALCYGKLGNREQERKFYIKTSKLKSNKSTEINFIARALISIEKFSLAKKLLKKLVKKRPKNRPGWYSLGLSEYYLKNFKEAALSIEQYVKIEPDIIGYLFLSQLYGILENPKTALILAKKALKINHNSALGWYLQGLSYRDLGKSTLSLTSLKKSSQIQPNHYSTWYELGSLYIKNNQLKKAASCFEKTIKIDPMNPDGWIRMLTTVSYQKNIKAKIPILKNVIKKYPENNLLKILLGIFYSEIDDHETAIKIFQSLLTIGKEDNDSLLGLIGTEYYEMNEYVLAEKNFKESVTINPKNSTSWMYLASSQAALGKNVEATNSLIVGLSLDKNLLDIFRNEKNLRKIISEERLKPYLN